jgi:DNA-binding GntR family transcriptional regulator
MEHEGIREAIANRDPGAAEHAMSEHIRNSFYRFARAFDEVPAALAEAALVRMAPNGDRPPGPHHP